MKKFHLPSLLFCILSLFDSYQFVYAQDILRIAASSNSAPLVFSQKNKLIGFDIEVMQALAEAMHKKLSWIEVKPEQLFPVLQAGRVDILANPFLITKTYQQWFHFTDPFLTSDVVILTKKNSSIHSMQDLEFKETNPNEKPYTVALPQSADLIDYFALHYPNLRKIEIDQTQKILDLLTTNQVDMIVVNKFFALWAIHHYPSIVRLKGVNVLTQYYRFAVSKYRPELIYALNAALEKIKADGVYDHLYFKWLGKQL